jgi:hypothetical protein
VHKFYILVQPSAPCSDTLFLHANRAGCINNTLKALGIRKEGVFCKYLSFSIEHAGCSFEKDQMNSV